MKRKQSSVTAQGIAAIRAVESNKPPERRICYDPLARQLVNPLFYFITKLFMGYAERRDPGTTGFLVTRARFMDDYLQTCLDEGIDQLIILGAGLDSRAYRLEQLRSSVKVFEVDHPATQWEKIEKLKKILGELPQHVVFVSINFNDESLEKLFDFGYDNQQKTLFIWEGVTHYLTAEAVARTLQFVSWNAANGSSIIFDYVEASALTTSHKRGEILRMQRYKRFTGEQLTFGIEEGKIEEFLHRFGYSQIVNVTSKDLERAYCVGFNRNRPIAPIYAIVHATVRSDTA